MIHKSFTYSREKLIGCHGNFTSQLFHPIIAGVKFLGPSECLYLYDMLTLESVTWARSLELISRLINQNLQYFSLTTK